MKQLIVEMQKESLSTEEYQALYIQFQVKKLFWHIFFLLKVLEMKW